MIIYHGHPSPTSIEQCRDAAPSYTHGAEWSPAKMTPHDWPFILDNGAYHAFVNGFPWDATAFVGRLNQIDSMPRDPDFVVLPDSVANPEETKERSQQWADLVKFRTAFAVQNGLNSEEAVQFADRIGAGVLFVGGTINWKRKHAPEIVEAAHDHGLECHIGRPSDLVWARDIGADSVDTISIVRNESWGRLRRLEQNSSIQLSLIHATEGGRDVVSNTGNEQ